jgi:CheY-like chemotaxis protein
MTEQAKILIVDDSADNRFLLRMLLEDDHLVSEADSGEACLSSIEQDKPDLLLLDVKMPGLDGYQVCQELRKKSETEDLPIIFVSGLDSSEERLAGFEAGGDEYIIKPVDETDLLTKVSSYLNKKKEREAVHHDASQSMKMALEAMTVSSELGQIIGFVKSGQSLKTHKSIGEAMLSIADDFQLNASVMVKAETPFFFGCDANSVEANFLAKAAESSERMLMIGVRFVIRDKNIVMII